MTARNAFGGLAFGTTILVVALVLSPFVPDTKEAIANVILGNVLGWPALVLAYHFGTTQSSGEKNRMLETITAGPQTVKIDQPADAPVPITDVAAPDFARFEEPKP